MGGGCYCREAKSKVGAATHVPFSVVVVVTVQLQAFPFPTSTIPMYDDPIHPPDQATPPHQ